MPQGAQKYASSRLSNLASRNQQIRIHQLRLLKRPALFGQPVYAHHHHLFMMREAEHLPGADLRRGALHNPAIYAQSSALT